MIRVNRSIVAAIGMLVIAVAGLIFLPSRNHQPERPDPVPESLRTREPKNTSVSLAGLRELSERSSHFVFEDVALEAGVEFRYYGSPSPEMYMTEQNGGGVAIFDFDGDDQLDLFFVNGSHFEQSAAAANQSSALYRNRGSLKFQQVTSPSGLTQFGFGMGCAAGDFDNDGFCDLFVTGYGENRLWRNNGDGTFQQIGIGLDKEENRWSTSAAWADLDADGDLDLYVVNYVDYLPTDPPCYSQHHPPIRRPCGPLGRSGQADLLYENLGDGRFADAAQSSGIGSFQGKGLGVSIADFDDDGLLDIYVANDTTDNLLFRNQGGLRFEEQGLISGAALGSNGIPRSGMGVSCADYNLDSRLDLFVTNFMAEPNDLYENLGELGFRPANTNMGLDAASRPKLGFGAVFSDFDLDSDPELFVTNGHVWDLREAGLGYEYAMHALLFENDGGTRFHEVSASSGSYFQQRWIGRAAAAGDLDNDGDPDLVVTHLVEPAAILRNDSQAAERSVRVRLLGDRSSRSVPGVKVDVRIAGDVRSLRVPSGDSFQSSSDSRLIVPVPEQETTCEMRVHWPGTPLEEWRTVRLPATKNPDQTLLIRERDAVFGSRAKSRTQ